MWWSPGVRIFFGHFIPGSVILAGGILWLWDNIKRFCRHQRSGKCFESCAAVEECPIWPWTWNKKWHFECFVGIPLQGFTFFYEGIGSFIYHYDNRIVDVNNLDHVAMVTIGLVRLFIIYMCHGRSGVPKGTVHAITALALFLQAPLFNSHNLYASGMVHIHSTHKHIKNLFYLTGLILLFEAVNPRHLIAAIARCYCLILAGFWVPFGAGLVFSDWYHNLRNGWSSSEEAHWLAIAFVAEALIIAVLVAFLVFIFQRQAIYECRYQSIDIENWSEDSKLLNKDLGSASGNLEV